MRARKLEAYLKKLSPLWCEPSLDEFYLHKVAPVHHFLITHLPGHMNQRHPV